MRFRLPESNLRSRTRSAIMRWAWPGRLFMRKRQTIFDFEPADFGFVCIVYKVFESFASVARLAAAVKFISLHVYTYIYLFTRSWGLIHVSVSLLSPPKIYLYRQLVAARLSQTLARMLKDDRAVVPCPTSGSPSSSSLCEEAAAPIQCEENHAKVDDCLPSPLTVSNSKY